MYKYSIALDSFKYGRLIACTIIIIIDNNCELTVSRPKQAAS